jgi:hypothetical protein
VVVTLIDSLSGNGPDYFIDGEEGAKAATNAVNAAGGIGGHPLQLKVCDEEWNPAVSEACGRQAVADHSIAVIGLSALDSYDASIFAAGIPCVGCIAAQASEITSPLNYTVGAGGYSIASGEGWILGALGLKHVAIPYAAIPGITVYKQIAVGLDITSPHTTQTNIGIPETATDMAPYAAQAGASGIDGIATLLAYDTVPLLVSDILQTSSTAKLIIPYEDFQPSLLKALGSSINRVVWSAEGIPGQDTSDPRTTQFNAEYKALGSSVPVDGTTEEGWGAIHAIADVMKGSTNLTAAGLVAAMKSSGTINLGIIAPFTWSKPVETAGPINVYSNDRFFFTYNGSKVTPVFSDFQDVTKAPTASPNLGG